LAGWPPHRPCFPHKGGKATAKATLRSVMACDGMYFELLYTCLTMLSPTAPLALRSRGTKDPLRMPHMARTADSHTPQEGLLLTRTRLSLALDR
jgi:hypothetical protein